MKCHIFSLKTHVIFTEDLSDQIDFLALEVSPTRDGRDDGPVMYWNVLHLHSHDTGMTRETSTKH